MKPRISGFFYFVLAVAAVVLSLKILDWLPGLFQKDMMSRYGTLEEVEAKLNLRNLHVPSYFPQTIMWPPADILAQAKPYPAVVMIFNAAGKREVALVISQAASDSFAAPPLIPLEQITRTVTYDMKGKTARLEVGACKDNVPCSRISWTDAGDRITLAMKAPPFELVRIAESMVR